MATENCVNRRRGGSKARTGCMTCKIRRVKCDETKPYCLRCTRFGRACGGYGGPKPKADKREGRKSDGMVVIKPRPILTLYNPTLAIPGNGDERRYFHLFSQKTAAQLRGYFDSIFWTQIVLQTSLTEPAIRYAVTAIASLSRVEEEPPMTSRPMGISKISDEHYRFGIEQYNKAIMSLRGALFDKGNALRTALIACVLFVCIEAIQGDQIAASGQVHGGLNLIQQVHRSRLKRGKSGKQTLIEDEIMQMYTNMNVQSFFLVFSQNPHHPPVGLPSQTQECQHHIFSSSVPSTFTSVLEAKCVLDSIINSIVQFFNSCTASTEGRVDKYARHHARLRQWEFAFQPLLLRAKASPAVASASATTVTATDLDAKVAPVVLSAYHRVGVIVLAASLKQDEIQFDSLHDDFEYIVFSCRSVLDTLTAPKNNNIKRSDVSPHQVPPRPRFSFEVGIIPPLYIVGSKCREPVLRRQAIELLKRCAVQEGMWEPFGTSRICEWMMEIEESGLVRTRGDDERRAEDGVVPESSRVRLTGMRSELSRRRIWVQCKGVVPQTDEGLVKVWETLIKW